MYCVLKCPKCKRIVELNSQKSGDNKVRILKGPDLDHGIIRCSCDIALFHIPGVMTWENEDLQSMKDSGIFEDVTPELGNTLFNEEKSNE